MKSIIEGAEGVRVFVNLGSSACQSGCNYCYVPPGRPQPYDWSDIESAVRNTIASESFKQGREGTIVTFGGHTEIYRSRQLTELLARALAIVCPLGNPVQISTKQYVSIETLRGIYVHALYSGQITMFVSCASATASDSIEPGADAPEMRWLTFANQRAFGMPRSLLIKPWLHDLTTRDIPAFASLAAKYEIKAVCLGAFYVTQAIAERVGDFSRALDALSGSGRHPLMRESHFSVSPPSSVLSEFRAQLGHIPLYTCSICISSAFANVQCPLHTGARCEVGC